MIQISKLLIFIIQVYQKFSSRSGIRHCRFYPTCSQYFVEALQKYGFFKGSYLGIRRILKCHPFHPGGYDPLK